MLRRRSKLKARPMIQIHACAHHSEFDIANSILVEMGHWAAAGARRAGIPDANDVLGTYYGATPDALMSKFTEPDAAFFLARWNGECEECAPRPEECQGVGDRGVSRNFSSSMVPSGRLPPSPSKSAPSFALRIQRLGIWPSRAR